MRTDESMAGYPWELRVVSRGSLEPGSLKEREKGLGQAVGSCAQTKGSRGVGRASQREITASSWF